MSTPLDCNGAEQALAERLSQPAGTAPVPAAPGLTQHLAVCAACRGHEAETRTLMETLRDQAVPDPGPSYWRRFPARVRVAIESPGRPRRRRAVLAWPAWTALAAAALLAVFLIRPSATTPDTREIGPSVGGGNDVAARRSPGPAGKTLTGGASPRNATADDETVRAAGATDPFTELASSLAAREPDEAALDSVLDDLLGGPALFELMFEMNDLSPEQQRELLDTLHAALEESA